MGGSAKRGAAEREARSALADGVREGVRTALLLRHARGEKRRAWDGPEPLRPLSRTGLAQAEALAPALLARGIDRALTSPALRCRQTVAPLAKLGGPVALRCEELGEGAPADKALGRILAEGARTVLVCGHRQQLADLGPLLEEQGLHVEWLDTGAFDVEPEPGARLGVLDLGSTSFHLLVAEVTRAGHLTVIDRERTQLRLGGVIARDHRIPEDMWRLVLDVTERLVGSARRLGAGPLHAVGTAALRDASNGPDLARAIGERVGEPVRLLAGEEEARLIFRAFRRRVLMAPGRTLGVDLGGGSLELAVGDATDGALHFEATLPLGAARLASELAASDPMKKRDVRALSDRVHTSLQPMRSALRRARPSSCIAAGGTARALGHLAVGLRGLRPAASINQLALPLEELRALTEILVHTSHDERLRLPGMRRHRADLLPTGALVLLGLAEALGLDGYTLCDWGLREGVLLEASGA